MAYPQRQHNPGWLHSSLESAKQYVQDNRSSVDKVRTSFKDSSGSDAGHSAERKR